jgi:hypothetical protein
LGEQIAEKLADKNMLELLDSPEIRAIADRVLGKPRTPGMRPDDDQMEERFDFQSVMTGTPLSGHAPNVAQGSRQNESEPPRKITSRTDLPNKVPDEAGWSSPVRRNQFVD